MSDQTIVIVVLAGVLVAVIAAIALWRIQRRRRLQEWFGPEYERAVETAGSRRAAEADLIAREKRYASFDLHPLEPAIREDYATRWAAVQERFVDDPQGALGSAELLVTQLMADRGYPIDEDEAQRIADLSVEHGHTIGHYQEAVDISARSTIGAATTEERRQAMVHYRALFTELLSAGSSDDGPPDDGPQAGGPEAAPDMEVRTETDVSAATPASAAAATGLDGDRLIPRFDAGRDEPDQPVLAGQRDRARAELDDTPLDRRRPA